MYAAAGGASLASRQARQKQKQNKKAAAAKQLKENQLEKQQNSLQLPKGGLAGSKNIGQSTSKSNLANIPAHAKAYHNVTCSYYNQKLKAGAVGTLRPPFVGDRRNSSNVQNHLQQFELPKSRSASKIHHSQSCMFPADNKDLESRHLLPGPNALHPCPSSPIQPGHSCQQLLVPIPATTPQQQGSDLDEPFPDGAEPRPLERRCSVRQRTPNDPDTMLYDDQNQHNHMQYNEEKAQWDLNPALYGYVKDCYDLGSLDFPFSECSQGRAAWQERERERRGSLTEAAISHRARQTEAHLRWMKRNRIHDTTFGGSSDEEDLLGVRYGHQSAAANVLLYVGLGTIAIGAVIFFVGTGEKGFKTVELRMIGPALVGCGLLFCIVRIILCVCPMQCMRKHKRKPPSCRHAGGSRRYRGAGANNDEYHMADQNTSLLRKQTGSKKRVSIAPNRQTANSSTNNFNNIASTSIFLQNEQEQNLVPKLIPTITVPTLELDGGDASDLNKPLASNRKMTKEQLETADTGIALQCMDRNPRKVTTSSGNCERVEVKSSSTLAVEASAKAAQSKMNRKREPLNGQHQHQHRVTETSLTEDVHTKTYTSNQTDAPSLHGEIVLSPSKLGQ